MFISTTMRRGFRTEKARKAKSGEEPKGDGVSDWKGSKPRWQNPKGTHHPEWPRH